MNLIKSSKSSLIFGAGLQYPVGLESPVVRRRSRGRVEPLTARLNLTALESGGAAEVPTFERNVALSELWLFSSHRHRMQGVSVAEIKYQPAFSAELLSAGRFLAPLRQTEGLVLF